eukprot:1727912-Rhodomonas_salina.1
MGTARAVFSYARVGYQRAVPVCGTAVAARYSRAVLKAVLWYRLCGVGADQRARGGGGRGVELRSARPYPYPATHLGTGQRDGWWLEDTKMVLSWEGRSRAGTSTKLGG